MRTVNKETELNHRHFVAVRLTNAHFHKNKKREDIKSHHYIISYVPADVKTEKSSHSERTRHGFENENK